MHVHPLFSFFLSNFYLSRAPLAALIFFHFHLFSFHFLSLSHSMYIQWSRDMTLELSLHTGVAPDFMGYPVDKWVYKYRYGVISAKLNQGHLPRTNTSPFSFFFHPHQACPCCHPASSLDSPLPLSSTKSIQPASWLAPFLVLYGLQ